MVAFGHTAIGVIVGAASYQVLAKSDIALGLILTGIFGVVSHYLMDLVPHGHYFTGMKSYDKLIIWVIIFDLLLPIIFILTLAHFLNKSGTEILYLVFGIGGAQLPDVLDGLKRIRLLPKINLLEAENKFHASTHWHGKEEQALKFSYLDVWQVTVLFLSLFILIRL